MTSAGQCLEHFLRQFRARREASRRRVGRRATAQLGRYGVGGDYVSDLMRCKVRCRANSLIRKSRNGQQSC